MATSTVTANSSYAMKFFQSKGWTQAQAAGIVGNLQAESGINLKTTAVGDGGSAYGIAQWHPDRQANFLKLYGRPIQNSTLDQQLAFVDWELNNTEKSAGNKIRATTNASDAAIAVDQYYERSSGTARGTRVAYANTLNGSAPSTATPDAVTPQQNSRIQNQQNNGPGNETAGFQEDGSVEPVIDTATGQPNNVGKPQSFGKDFSEPDVIDVSQPLPNVLHNYPSYTYGLSLHLLTADEYNGLSKGSIINYSPVRVLVASAGRWQSETNGVIPNGPNGVFNRSPYFAEDFYFDGLTMTTVIGTNAQSRNTNAIEFSFNLIEPYGMTLINRLLDQANDPEVACPNYLDMIYLLQIDFFATDDAGVIVGAIPGTTKRFPVKITQMNITASGTGSRYEIQAVPYNHSAFDQTTVSTPTNMEVSAGTVGEFFESGTGTNPQGQVNSFASGLNGWTGDLAKNNKIGVPDTYSFDIDPIIAQSGFTSAGTISPRDTGMANPLDTSSIRLSNLGQATTDFNAQTRTFSINAGTSIDRVIDYTMRNSGYIQNQINIPDGIDPQTYLQQKASTSNQPLNWYKITPEVTLGQFDPMRKVYARNVTYTVSPYVIYNAKSDVAPQGKVSNVVKEYNYIYTGRNVDVIDFELNFNTLYYTAQTAYRGAVENLYKTSSGTAASDPTANPSSYLGATQDPNNVMPLVMKPQVYNAKTRATGGSISPKDVAVADLEDSLMTLSAADMLNVQLKIIGDPQFLKQDDCFYSVSQSKPGSGADPRLTPNGSLRTDYSEIYVKLLFRTPIDVNEATGLMNFGAKYKTSVFSGVYRVLTVQSEFTGGTFTQTLNIIRLPNQPTYDYSDRPQLSSSLDQRVPDIVPSTTPSLSTNPMSMLNIPIPKAAQAMPESGGQQAAQNLLSRNFNDPPTITAAQADLRNINNTTTAVPITNNTAPNPFAGLPAGGDANQATQNARNLLGGG